MTAAVGPGAAATVAGPALAWPLLRRDLALAAIALLLLLAWDVSGLDLTVERLFAGPGGFPWRDHWLMRLALHDGGRLLAGLMLALLAVNVWRPLIGGPPRRERALWLLSTVLSLLLISALKQWSLTSCPWDLAEFGGGARHVPHWALGVADGGPGRCFPSGHASAAFAYFSGHFVLRRHRPRIARRWLLGVVAFGLLFGLAQALRGAHYPSHTLWSAWLCWTLSLLLAPRTVATGQPGSAPPPPP